MKLFSFTTLLAVALFSAMSFAEDSPIQAAANAQPDEVKARYQYRNPVKTLEFFGVEPGMTVVEVFPGDSGWYSKILLGALGEDGELIGADYSQDQWPLMGMPPEGLEQKKTWVDSWTSQADDWRDTNSAKVDAFQFDELPESMKDKADVVFIARAMHHWFRLEENGGFLSNGLKEVYAALKPGGTVGIVQHQAREDRPDDWANGNNGYLKKSAVKAKMKEFGFEFVDESAINENPKDQADEGDWVWRLPPSLSIPSDGDDTKESDIAKKKAAMESIGESHRMTLLFRKPSAK